VLTASLFWSLATNSGETITQSDISLG